MEPGDFVNLYVIDPIEKIWGRLVRISDAGIVVRGFDVKLIESYRYQFQKEEPEVYPQTTFWPMRRVQKLDLDEAMGDIPSVIESLKRTTGLSADEILPPPQRAS
ncbi:MAG: hypothetical protein QNK37_22975 [Acidobacteriota bacterium]|nr:hypothetical protein [Acidobacteriota bacterium]